VRAVTPLSVGRDVALLFARPEVTPMFVRPKVTPMLVRPEGAQLVVQHEVGPLFAVVVALPFVRHEVRRLSLHAVTIVQPWILGRGLRAEID